MARVVPITTPAAHEAALARLDAKHAFNPAYPDSQWLDMATGRYRSRDGLTERRPMQTRDLRDVEEYRAHHDALRALAMGAVHGIPGPAIEGDFLVDAKNNVVAYEKVWKAFERQPAKEMWKLPRAQAERFGRWNIPAGEKSRIQKQLGLREAHLVVPAKPEVAIVMDYSHGGMSPRPLYVVAPL